MLHHDAAGGLAGEEGPFQVDGQGQVKIIFADVFDQVARPQPGIVDQDVQPAEMSGRRLNGLTHLVKLGHIHGQAQRAAAHAFNLLRQVGAGPRVAQPQRHVGARVCQGQRAGPPDAAGSAGYQRHLTVKVEAGKVAI